MQQPTTTDASIFTEIVPLVHTRINAARFLQTHGYLISEKRLAKLAVEGGGPAYRRWGRQALYTADALLEWAQSRACKPQTNKSVSG